MYSVAVDSTIPVIFIKDCKDTTFFSIVGMFSMPNGKIVRCISETVICDLRAVAAKLYCQFTVH